MSKQITGIFHRIFQSISDWKGTDIPLGSGGIAICVRPTANGGVRLSFGPMVKP